MQNFTTQSTRSTVASMMIIAIGAILITGAIFFASCSSSTDPGSGQGTATFQSESSAQGNISSMIKGGDGNSATGGLTVDSIKVTRVRVLISRVILHAGTKTDGTDDADETEDKPVKVGPFLLIIDSTGQRFVTSALVPATTYNKVKFEIRKFSTNEADSSLFADSSYTDFRSSSRITVIIDGRLWPTGTTTPASFTYKGDPTANLTLKFNPPVALAADANTTFTFELDPVVIFKEGSNKPLDPRDASNASKINNLIKQAIKALKK